MSEVTTNPAVTEFIDELKMHLGEYLDEIIDGDYSMNFGQTVKTNDCKYNNLAILAEDSKVAPNINLDDYIKQYEEGRSLDDIIRDIVDVYKSARDHDLPVSEILNFSDFESIKDKLVTKLVNKELSSEYLKNVPYRNFGDLAVICQYKVHSDGNSIGCITINNDHLEMWGKGFDEVFTIAKENDAKNSRPKLMPMDKVLFGRSSYDQEDLIPDEKCGSMEMYVLITDDMHNGAKLIYNKDVMDRIGDFFGGDYVIVPSSTEEVIIIPKDSDIPTEDLSTMIREVNSEYVSKDQILSDHAYMYDRKDKCLFFEKDGKKHLMKFDEKKKGVKEKLKNAETKVKDQAKSDRRVKAAQVALA